MINHNQNPFNTTTSLNQHSTNYPAFANQKGRPQTSLDLVNQVRGDLFEECPPPPSQQLQQQVEKTESLQTSTPESDDASVSSITSIFSKPDEFKAEFDALYQKFYQKELEAIKAPTAVPSTLPIQQAPKKPLSLFEKITDIVFSYLPAISIV